MPLMKIQKTFFLPLLAGVMALRLCAPALAVAESDSAPIPIRASAYLVKKNGVVLWSAQDEVRLPPASLTKIMTALLALEVGRLDRVVTVSAEAAAQTGSRLNLRAGDRLTLFDLLRATLIKSANDASYALAEGVAGDAHRFVSLMNARAASMGLHNTRFANVCGLDAENHYSTARDLARLAEVAMRHPLFRSIVATERCTIGTVDNHRTFDLHTSNRLIGQYGDVAGIKTGFTRGAGRCLVALSSRGGDQVLLVLLNAPRRWREAPLLFDAAFTATTTKRQEQYSSKRSSSPAPL